MMLALVEAHEKTLGSQQSVDPSCAFIVLMCREDFSITPPGFLSNSGSLSENVATQLWTRWWSLASRQSAKDRGR